MQIQVNTDNHIEGRQALEDYVKTTIASSLDRFSTRITRIEVHLSDENGDKHGQHDKRCVIEARLAGRKPSAVTCDAGTLQAAITGGIDKLKTSIERTLGRLSDHHERGEE